MEEAGSSETSEHTRYITWCKSPQDHDLNNTHSGVVRDVIFRLCPCVLEYWYTFTRLNGVTSQKAVVKSSIKYRIHVINGTEFSGVVCHIQALHHLVS